MELSPGGLQGSSVRGEKVHQDPRELLEPGDGDRDLPQNTPPHNTPPHLLGNKAPQTQGEGSPPQHLHNETFSCVPLAPFHGLPGL